MGDEEIGQRDLLLPLIVWKKNQSREDPKNQSLVYGESLGNRAQIPFISA
jgi:hypothetical protein